MRGKRFFDVVAIGFGIVAGLAVPRSGIEVVAADPPPAYWMGASAVDVTPPVGVPLAGYGGIDRRIVPWDVLYKHRYAHFFKPSKGVHDPIRAKSLVVALGEKKVLFVSLDVIGVETPFVDDVRRIAAEIGIRDVVITATHTHSGPGTLGRNPFFGILATDRFKPKVYRKFLAGVKESIVRASAALEPVALYRAQFDAVDIQRNRREQPGVFDSRATLVYGTNPAGEIVGGMLNLAVHPTVMGEANLLLSADLAGGIERHVTAALGAKNPILFVNGAEGDVSPIAGPSGGFEGIEEKSAEFARAAAEAAERSVALPARIEIRRGTFKFPKGRIRLAKCVKLPKILRGIKIGGRNWFPREFELTQLELGDLLFMSWPGEPTTVLGEAGKKLAAERGFGNVVNLGLANGYFGYFLTEDEFAKGGYETCVSYHGPKAGKALLDGHAALFAR